MGHILPWTERYCCKDLRRGKRRILDGVLSTAQLKFWRGEAGFVSCCLKYKKVTHQALCFSYICSSYLSFLENSKPHEEETVKGEKRGIEGKAKSDIVRGEAVGMTGAREISRV